MVWSWESIQMHCNTRAYACLWTISAFCFLTPALVCVQLRARSAQLHRCARVHKDTHMPRGSCVHMYLSSTVALFEWVLLHAHRLCNNYVTRMGYHDSAGHAMCESRRLVPSHHHHQQQEHRQHHQHQQQHQHQHQHQHQQQPVPQVVSSVVAHCDLDDRDTRFVSFRVGVASG